MTDLPRGFHFDTFGGFMTETNTQKPKNRAVLVGLWAYRLEREENATEESMEELAALLD